MRYENSRIARVSITTLLPVVFSVLLVAYTILVILISNANSFRLGQTFQGNTLSLSAHQVAVRIRYELAAMQKTLTDLARQVNNLSVYDSESLEALLESNSPRLQYARRIVITGMMGETVYDTMLDSLSARPLMPHNLSSLPEGFAPGYAVDTQPLLSHISFDLGNPGLAGTRGTTRPGYIMKVFMDWNWIDPFIQEGLADLRKQMSLDTLLLRFPDGLVLAGPPALGKKNLSLTAYPNLSFHARGWIEEEWAREGTCLVGYASTGLFDGLGGFGMAVLLRQSIELTRIPVRQNTAIFLGTAGLLGLVFIFLVFKASNLLAAPLVRLAESIRSWRRDSSTEFPLIPGPKEVREVSLAFRELVKNLGHVSRARIKAEKLATHDPLTRLPNRLALEEYLADNMIWEERHVFRIFLFLDLDGFKEVNDQWGHDAGDAVLTEIARRLLDSSRGETLCVRLGGDEFLLILRLSLRDFQTGAPTTPESDSSTWGPLVHATANPAIQRLLESCAQPVHWQKGDQSIDLQVSGSLGCALWPLDNHDPAQVLLLADQAMYQAKKAGKNRHVWHGMEA